MDELARNYDLEEFKRAITSEKEWYVLYEQHRY